MSCSHSFSVCESMKCSAAVCCAAAVSWCCERCLKQVRVKSQSSFVFTAVLVTSSAQKYNILQTARRRVRRGETRDVVAQFSLTEAEENKENLQVTFIMFRADLEMPNVGIYVVISLSADPEQNCSSSDTKTLCSAGM